MTNIEWGGADHLSCSVCGMGPGHADDCTRAVPRATGDVGELVQELKGVSNDIGVSWRIQDIAEHAAARITADQARIAELEGNLASRDSFIVNAGMFDEYLRSIGALGAKP